VLDKEIPPRGSAAGHRSLPAHSGFGPWLAKKVDLQVTDNHVDIWLELAPGVGWPCPRYGRNCLVEITQQREPGGT
jgi:hypothetical protein